MAIKGKGKSKRRGVATGPKPVYVQPKTPLFRRRGFVIGLLLVVTAGIAAGMLTGLSIKSSNDREEAERAIVAQFTRQVNTLLQSVGQPFQTSFIPFPTLSQDVAAFKSGDASVKDALKRARDTRQSTRVADDQLQAIDAQALIRDRPELLDVIDVQTVMSAALETFEEAADILTLAAKARRADRQALITQTEDLVALATKEFDSAYSKLNALRSRYGLIGAVPISQVPNPLNSEGPGA